MKVLKQTEAWMPTTKTNLQDVFEKQEMTNFRTCILRHSDSSVFANHTRSLALIHKGSLLYGGKQKTYLTNHSSFMSCDVYFFGSSSPRASFINPSDGNPKASELKCFKMYKSVTVFTDFKFNT